MLWIIAVILLIAFGVGRSKYELECSNMNICPKCNGSGCGMEIYEPCDRCKGTGEY